MALRFNNETELQKFFKNRNTSSGTVYESNSESAIEWAYNEAIQTLRSLQGTIRPMFDRRSVGLKITMSGRRAADKSNILKSIEDAFNRIVFQDDRQVERIEIDSDR